MGERSARDPTYRRARSRGSAAIYVRSLILAVEMIALVFSYEVRDAAHFEAVYGPEGEWAQCCGGAQGYIGTELLRDVETPGRYLVVDRWESPEAYNAFVADHREEYMQRVDETRFLYE